MRLYSLLLMNSFNKTEAAVFSCRLCFLRAFPFISLICGTNTGPLFEGILPCLPDGMFNLSIFSL